MVLDLHVPVPGVVREPWDVVVPQPQCAHDRRERENEDAVPHDEMLPCDVMGASVLESFDEIAQAEVTLERFGIAIHRLADREDRVEERGWLEAGRKRIADAFAAMGDLRTRVLVLPELAAFRGEITRNLQSDAVDVVDGLLAAITKLNERSPLIEVLFRNVKPSVSMRKAKSTDFEAYCSDFEKRMASSYAARMLADESYAPIAPNLEKLHAAFAAWRESLKPAPLDPELDRALRSELEEASRVTFLVRQSLLLAEAALLAEPAVREESGLFEKPRRRSTRAA